MRLSRLSQDAARQMLADSADPRWREMSRLGAPCAAGPAENLELLWRLVRMLGPYLGREVPDRSVPAVHRFLL